MEITKTNLQTVIRTERGLTIAGTRITLHSIMDYVNAAYPPHLIRAVFSLTDRQSSDVITYFTSHREKV